MKLSVKKMNEVPYKIKPLIVDFKDCQIKYPYLHTEKNMDRNKTQF